MKTKKRRHEVHASYLLAGEKHPRNIEYHINATSIQAAEAKAQDKLYAIANVTWQHIWGTKVK